MEYVDRQPTLDRLLIEPARRRPEGRFAVAGPQYPHDIEWPSSVQRFNHIPPAEHRRFYCRQRFTLNVTRAHMIQAGYAPSVRLFEAAACGVPIISDWWEGLDALFEPDREILIARTSEDSLNILQSLSEHQRREIGRRARERVIEEHTASRRAAELAACLNEAATHKTGPLARNVQEITTKIDPED